MLAKTSRLVKYSYRTAVQVVENSDIVFLAVKPQYVSVVLKEVRGSLTDRHTIVSIAAGVTLTQLKASSLSLLAC